MKPDEPALSILRGYAMQEVTQILGDATAAIASDFFLLPIHGGTSVYRERVYCYELYHQMRRLWPPDCPYRLNGEVDKRAHHTFRTESNPSQTCSSTNPARARTAPSLRSNPPAPQCGTYVRISELFRCLGMNSGIREPYTLSTEAILPG